MMVGVAHRVEFELTRGFIDKVERPRHGMLKQEEEEEEEADAEAPFDDDVAMSDSDVPKPKPRARKAKKVVPVGSNGLKKKRVMRTEKFVDDKGYMSASLPPSHSLKTHGVCSNTGGV